MSSEEQSAPMKTFSITLGFLEMFTGTVREINDMVPSAENFAGAKGFETVQTSLVDRLDKLDSTSHNGGRKYER